MNLLTVDSISPLMSSPIDFYNATTLIPQMGTLAGHIFETANQCVADNPYIAVLGVGAISLAYLFRSKIYPSPADPFIELLKNPNAFNPDAIKNEAEKFAASVSPKLNNDKTIKYLAKKLEWLLTDNSYDDMMLLINNVKEDFINLVRQAEARVTKDMRQGRLSSLGISTSDRIVGIEALGDETHNGGKIPLLFIFESGKSIVYKPRSMLPEQVICGKEDSVFAEAGLGTYQVVCQEDRDGEYGYSQRLRNDVKKMSIEDLQKYYDQFELIDEVCGALTASDMHGGNFITEDGIPYFIDVESFENPEGVSTGLKELCLIHSDENMFELSFPLPDDLNHKLRKKLLLRDAVSSFGIDKLVQLGVQKRDVRLSAQVRAKIQEARIRQSSFNPVDTPSGFSKDSTSMK